MAELRLSRAVNSFLTIQRTMTLNPGAAVMEPIWINDRLISNALAPDHLLLELHSDGSFARWFPHAGPFTEESLSHKAGRTKLNRTRLAFDPRTQRVALAFQMVNRIDFFSGNGCRIATAFTPRTSKPSYQIRRNAEGKLAFAWTSKNELTYVAADANADNVIALFCGTCVQERSLPVSADVFAWETGFVGTIELDVPVYTIALSQQSLLLGAADEPYPRVVVWDLTALHKQ